MKQSIRSIAAQSILLVLAPARLVKPGVAPAPAYGR